MIVKLDRKGITEVLMSDWIQGEVHARAEQIATAARASLPSDDNDVVVDDYDFKPRGRTTDRRASSVTYRSPAAMNREAKHGTLIRAAGSTGLEVTAR